MNEANKSISQARHHLGLAALAYLMGDTEQVKQQMRLAGQWAKDASRSLEEEQREQYQHLLRQGQALRAITDPTHEINPEGGQHETPEEEAPAQWTPTSDGLGATMWNGQTLYTVHIQPSRRHDQWAWGWGDGHTTHWATDRHHDEESARHAAAQHSMSMTA